MQPFLLPPHDVLSQKIVLQVTSRIEFLPDSREAKNQAKGTYLPVPCVTRDYIASSFLRPLPPDSALQSTTHHQDASLSGMDISLVTVSNRLHIQHSAKRQRSSSTLCQPYHFGKTLFPSDTSFDGSSVKSIHVQACILLETGSSEEVWVDRKVTLAVTKKLNVEIQEESDTDHQMTVCFVVDKDSQQVRLFSFTWEQVEQYENMIRYLHRIQDQAMIRYATCVREYVQVHSPFLLYYRRFKKLHEVGQSILHYSSPATQRHIRETQLDPEAWSDPDPEGEGGGENPTPPVQKPDPSEPGEEKLAREDSGSAKRVKTHYCGRET